MKYIVTDIYFFQINQLVKIAAQTEPEHVCHVPLKISNEGLKIFASADQYR
jgi:hypothetical protein